VPSLLDCIGEGIQLADRCSQSLRGLVVALLAGAVIGPCPPWLEVRPQIPASNNENLRPVATEQGSVYAPVFRPPQPWLDEPHPDLMDERVTYRVDGMRLLAQFAALACLTGGLALLVGRRA
jgi:hypothetical protein